MQTTQAQRASRAIAIACSSNAELAEMVSKSGLGLERLLESLTGAEQLKADVVEEPERWDGGW